MVAGGSGLSTQLFHLYVVCSMYMMSECIKSHYTQCTNEFTWTKKWEDKRKMAHKYITRDTYDMY